MHLILNVRADVDAISSYLASQADSIDFLFMFVSRSSVRLMCFQKENSFVVHGPALLVQGSLRRQVRTQAMPSAIKFAGSAHCFSAITTYDSSTGVLLRPLSLSDD